MTQPAERTALYRLYDTAGQLLYIGVARNPDVRWATHSQSKPWWPEVDTRKDDRDIAAIVRIVNPSLLDELRERQAANA